MNTLDKTRLLEDLQDSESRKLIYVEHISTGLPFQIRELRKKRKMTQKKLGEETGMDQSTISDLENPNYEYTPQIGTLQRLANAFDVPLIVRFGSWGELLEWETNLSSERVAPPKFEDDAKIKEEIRITASTNEQVSAGIRAAMGKDSDLNAGSKDESPIPKVRSINDYKNQKASKLASVNITQAYGGAKEA